MLAWLPPLFFLTTLMGAPVPGFLAFVVLGVLTLIRNTAQQSQSTWRWTRQDLGIALCFMSIPIFKILSALWSTQPQLAFINAGWHLYFLFWPLVLLGLHRCKANVPQTENALAAGLMVFAVYALALALSGETFYVPGVRPNVGILAQLAMTLGVWNVAFLTRPEATARARWMHGVAMLATMVVLVFTTRRLELIGFIGLTALVVLYRLRSRLTMGRALALAMAGISMLGALVYLRQEKFALGLAELNTYLYHRAEHPEVVYSSWGARLEMWRTAWAAFMDHPMLGLGASARPFAMQAWGGPDNLAEFGHRHFHSHLIQTLIEGGLVGLALLMVTLTYTTRHMILSAHRTHPEAALLAAGLLGAYAMEGLASAALQYDKPNAMLVVASAWVWLQMRTAVAPHSQTPDGN